MKLCATVSSAVFGGCTPPTAQVIPLRNVMRDDVARPSWPVEEVMLNAPAIKDGHFLVPPVLD